MGLMNLSIDRSFACQFCETRVGHGTTAHFFGMNFSLKVIVWEQEYLDKTISNNQGLSLSFDRQYHWMGL